MGRLSTRARGSNLCEALRDDSVRPRALSALSANVTTFSTAAPVCSPRASSVRVSAKTPNFRRVGPAAQGEIFNLAPIFDTIAATGSCLSPAASRPARRRSKTIDERAAQLIIVTNAQNNAVKVSERDGVIALSTADIAGTSRALTIGFHRLSSSCSPSSSDTSVGLQASQADAADAAERGQPRQVGLPRHHEPRDQHAAQRHPRHDRTARRRSTSMPAQRV